MTHARALAIGLFVLGLCGCRGTSGTEPAPASVTSTLAVVPVRIERVDGTRLMLRAELATRPADQARGLSHRAAMGPHDGMVFAFSPARPASFWMKDTRFALDIIFIAPDGRIVLVKSGAKPEDLTPISTGTAVAGVLELVGGHAERIGLGTGDIVHWGACARDDPPPVVNTATSFCPARSSLPMGQGSG